MRAATACMRRPRDIVAFALVWVLAAACLPNKALAEGPDPDMQPPGVARTLPFGVIDRLSWHGEDPSDVSAVWLNAGQTLKVALYATAGTRFLITILRPEALTEERFLLPEDDLAHSRTIDSKAHQQFVSFKAPASGRYFIEVWMVEGTPDGNYALYATTGRLWSVTRPTVPNYVKRGTWFDIEGTVKPGYFYDGKPVIVQVQKRVGGRWSTSATYNLKHRTAPYDTSLTSSKYGARAKLSAGRWRVRASIGKTAVMSRRYTSWREFTVR